MDLRDKKALQSMVKRHGYHKIRLALEAIKEPPIAYKYQPGSPLPTRVRTCLSYQYFDICKGNNVERWQQIEKVLPVKGPPTREAALFAAGYSEAELLRIPNFFHKSLAIVQAWLATEGLRVGMSKDEISAAKRASK